MNWRAVFPAVFGRAESGFDCVIGNPPWERMKLQEREFFSFLLPILPTPCSAAKRRELIAALGRGNPTLFARFQKAKEDADGAGLRPQLRPVPADGPGHINTYMLFAELARKSSPPTAASVR